jgi:quercetin dioxygenase-like cupin family protein
MSGTSRVVRAQGFRWAGVPLREYKDPGPHYLDVTRQTLLGAPDGGDALPFEVRYFEVGPGGHSTLERHRHPHAVMVLRGRGEVVLGDRTETVGEGDCVYVASDTWHQFLAAADAPLGFLCVVECERDRPVLPSQEDLAALRGIPALRDKLRA